MNLHIHCQTPHKHCHSPGAALRYLSRYIVGAAIHNARFLEDDGNYVTIRVKSYRKKRREIFKTLGG